MITLLDALRRHARHRGDHPAVIDEEGSMTYAALAERVWSVAHGLRSKGVVEGDVVAILTTNRSFSVEAYLGVLAAGATAAFLNWRWAPPELVHGLGECGARVVLVGSDLVGAIEAVRDEVPGVVVVVEADACLLGGGADPGLRSALDDANVILFTGGTTGFSKGVRLSHANVAANCINEIVDTDMSPDDVTLLITPMFHSASLLCWFAPHLVLGATSVLVRDFDPEHVAEVMARHRVTNGFLVPNMVRRLLGAGALDRTRLAAYRRMYVGGASFGLADKVAVAEVLPGASIYYQYGLTEAGPIVTRLRPEQMMDPELDGSIGFEFLLTEVTVRSADGVELPDGEVGELCVRGPNVMLGYHGRPEATAAVLRDGWLHTGDAVRRGPQGELWFHDRLKDMIKTGGENVYSAAVEQVLHAHPGVAEVAVIGVPSLEWDEEVRAIVVRAPGSPPVSEAELREHCRRSLAGYEVPKRFAFVEPSELPINPSGKIVKAELRAAFTWPDP